MVDKNSYKSTSKVTVLCNEIDNPIGSLMRASLLKYRFIYAFLRRNLYHFFRSQVQPNVDKQSFVIGKKRIYLAYEANLIQDCFNKGKRLHRESLKRIIGSGLFSEETSTASQERRALIQRLMTPDALRYIDHCILHHYDGFQCQQLANHLIVEQLKRLSVETHVAIVLAPQSTEDQRMLCSAVSVMLEYIEYDLHTAIKLPSKRKEVFETAKQQVLSYVSRCLTKQIELASEHSLLAGLLALFDQNLLDANEIDDEVLSLLGSGVGTTGTMLFWVLKCFLHHQTATKEVLDAIRYEHLVMQDAFGHQQFAYFIKETLRHYPTIWAMVRFIEDDSVAGVEAGSYVWMSPCATHFDERYWLQPNAFNPQRFSSGVTNEAFFPFAHGAHKCLGEYLAMTQMKAFLFLCATRLQREEGYVKVRRLSSTLALVPTGVKGYIEFA